MRYKIIAIEREYASGGREIGEKLAAKLGIPCYGEEILKEAAKKLNMSVEKLMEVEESMTNSLLFGLAAYANLSTGNAADLLSFEQRLALTENEIIRDLAVNPCVLIGRGAAALFRDNENVLKVFIHADIKMRADRAVNVYGIEPKQSIQVINRQDKRRANYFKATTDTEWKNPSLYHMFLNNGKLGTERVVDILSAAAALSRG